MIVLHFCWATLVNYHKTLSSFDRVDKSYERKSQRELISVHFR